MNSRRTFPLLYQRRSVGLAVLMVLVLLAAWYVSQPLVYAQDVYRQTHSPTWEQRLVGPVRFSSPTLADLDGDNKPEILVGTIGVIDGTSATTARERPRVYAFHEDGRPVSGWPVSVAAPIGSAPTVGDITGDGVPEVIVTSGTAGYINIPGGLYAFSASGQLLWTKRPCDINGGPNGVADGMFASPVLVDLDENGVLDVVAVSYDEHIYVYRGDGTPMPGWGPIEDRYNNNPNRPDYCFLAENRILPDTGYRVGDGIWSTPAVGDVDNDGRIDLVVAAETNPNVYTYGDAWSEGRVRGGNLMVFNNDGSLKPGWPKFVEGYIYQDSPVLVDLDGNGTLEIVVGSGEPGTATPPDAYHVTAWRVDGSIMWRRQTTDKVFHGTTAVGDIDGDGRPEIVAASSGIENRDARSIYAFNEDGSNVGGFPRPMLDGQDRRPPGDQAPILADVNSDGRADIVIGASWGFMAFNGSGTPLTDHLVLKADAQVANGSAIGDIDGDGNLEVIAATGNARNAEQGILYRWDLDVRASGDALPWPQFQHDAQHSGLFGALALPATPTPTNTTQPSPTNTAAPTTDPPTPTSTPTVTPTPAPGFDVSQSSVRTFILPDDVDQFTIQVNNRSSSGDELSWSATADQSWIRMNASSGTTPSNLVITVDATDYDYGSYRGSVTLQSPEDTMVIQVRMVVFDGTFRTWLPFVSAFGGQSSEPGTEPTDTAIPTSDVPAPTATASATSGVPAPTATASATSGVPAPTSPPTAPPPTFRLTDTPAPTDTGTPAVPTPTFRLTDTPAPTGTSTAPVPTSTPTPVGAVPTGRIAFHSDRGQDIDIYVLDMAGGAPRNLTNSVGSDYNADWSPDGSQIVFESDRDGDFEIFVMSADGGEALNLTNNDVRDANPVWSPDGSAILFESGSGDNQEIYVMNADGTNQRRLTANSRWDVRPFWSPDGNFIVFESGSEENWDIYIMDADGTNQRNISNHPAHDRLPTWSPDGQFILFTSDRDGNQEIYAMDVSGDNVVNLTQHPDSDRNGSWSPDGQFITFISDRTGDYEIYITEADGSLRQMTNNPATDGGPAWGP